MQSEDNVHLGVDFSGAALFLDNPRSVVQEASTVTGAIMDIFSRSRSTSWGSSVGLYKSIVLN